MGCRLGRAVGEWQVVWEGKWEAIWKGARLGGRGSGPNRFSKQNFKFSFNLLSTQPRYRVSSSLIGVSALL